LGRSSAETRFEACETREEALAVPQPVLDILSSFSIVSPVSGSQVDPSKRLTPALNTDPDGAFAVLTAPEILAALDLDIDLDDIKLTLSPADGKTNLNVVLKAVEFASLVPVSSPATGKLPYLVPTAAAPAYTLNIGSQVEGLLGTADGTIKLVEQIVGKLAGKITGNITRTLLLKAPKVSVTWTVQDAAGHDLTATQVVNLGTNEVPIYVLLPPFVEFTGGPVTTTERRISCTITVTVAGEQVTRIVGPVTLQMPEVQIPTLMVVTEHAQDDSRFPGDILIAVPANSAINLWTDLDSILSSLQFVMNGVATAAGSVMPAPPLATQVANAFSAVAGVPGVPGALDDMRKALSTPHHPYFSKADSDGWLHFGFASTQSFEDRASALWMVGPPGRRVRLYAGRRDFFSGNWPERFGTVNITLGPTGTVAMRNFATAMPPTGLLSGFGGLDSTVTAGVTGGLSNFDDQLSAYKFLGPQDL
jgi:hypothetical protein